MTHFFPHEKLHAYEQALRFAKLAAGWLDSWPSNVAVCGQLDRATESLVTNLATAARRSRTEQGIYALECSLGSALECAACLDVAERRHLVAESASQEAKRVLQAIARMEVGLRSSWADHVREEADEYGHEPAHFFPHESLVVYQRSLQVHEALDGLWSSEFSRCRYARRVDELSTSLTLNIAEGNGRFSRREHGNFVATAEDSATRLAAYLDLVQATTGFDADAAKSLLREVLAMLGGLKGYLTGKGGR